MFEPFGRINEVFVMKDMATGQGKGCAFVKYASKEHAVNAIRQLNQQHTVPGAPRPIEVRFAESKKAGQVVGGLGVGASSLVAGSSNVVSLPCNGPPSNTNPRQVGKWKEYFAADGRPYYFNEVTQTTQWEVPPEFELALQSAPSSGGGETSGPPGSNVFIFHVPNDWSHNDLVSNFAHFGRIVSAKIATDKITGRNQGFAFVSYDNIQSACNAVMQMNGYMASGKRLKVSIKKGEEQYVQHLMGSYDANAYEGVQSMPGGYGMGFGAQQTGYPGFDGLYAPQGPRQTPY